MNERWFIGRKDNSLLYFDSSPKGRVRQNTKVRIGVTEGRQNGQDAIVGWQGLIFVVKLLA
jgi:hypothetical protein